MRRIEPEVGALQLDQTSRNETCRRQNDQRQRDLPNDEQFGGAMLVMAAAVPAIVACGDSKLGPSTPASVSIVSGDTQSILVGDQASQPLIVGINNSDGSPLANIPGDLGGDQRRRIAAARD